MSGLAVLGSGAFGTALAIALARDRRVTLWCRSPERAADLVAHRENRRYLPGVSFPDTIAIETSLEAIGADTLLLALPTQQLGAFVTDHRNALAGKSIVLCCKGIDRVSGLRPSQLLRGSLPRTPVSVLTGPSFAADIARGLPTALCLAAPDGEEALQARLTCPTLRLYLTDDITGAEYGGALKNVIAIAAGLTIGAGLGDSARAAVITRGFAELSRFAVAEGARPETLAGLSGLGDLLPTCTSAKSRNFSAGIRIANGGHLPEGQTIEGIETARIMSILAEAKHIDLPLTRMVAAVIDGKLTVADAADVLMSRPLKRE